jgi:DNA-binding response OmpR family regulator
MRKIVCIDDEAPMNDLVGFILKSAGGFETHMAQSGQDGLSLIADIKPDLVLLDIMMPEMDGWEVYQTMKKNEDMSSIPVIIVTAKSQPIDKTLARSIAGVDDYITKPFTPQDLVSKIREVLGDGDHNGAQS